MSLDDLKKKLDRLAGKDDFAYAYDHYHEHTDYAIEKAYLQGAAHPQSDPFVLHTLKDQLNIEDIFIERDPVGDRVLIRYMLGGEDHWHFLYITAKQLYVARGEYR